MQAQLEAVIEAKAKDLRIDYVAFLEIVCKFEDGLSDFATLKRKFEVYDTEKTGFITHGQFRKIFSMHGAEEPLSLEEVEALLLEADPSKSGRVQYGQWLKAFLEEAKLPLPDMNAK